VEAELVRKYLKWDLLKALLAVSKARLAYYTHALDAAQGKARAARADLDVAQAAVELAKVASKGKGAGDEGYQVAQVAWNTAREKASELASASSQTAADYERQSSSLQAKEGKAQTQAVMKDSVCKASKQALGALEKADSAAAAGLKASLAALDVDVGDLVQKALRAVA
jgi:hypothetical protein